MPDRVTFLLARLDEEADTARRVDETPERWHVVAGGVADDHGYVHVRVDEADHETIAHVARQDPQATLDRIEALRGLVAIHRPIDPVSFALECVACSDGWSYQDDGYGFGINGLPADWPCPTLRALAYAYRRHPDYDPAWAPDGAEVAG